MKSKIIALTLIFSIFSTSSSFAVSSKTEVAKIKATIKTTAERYEKQSKSYLDRAKNDKANSELYFELAKRYDSLSSRVSKLGSEITTKNYRAVRSKLMKLHKESLGYYKFLQKNKK